MNTADRFRALSTGTVGRQRRALVAAVVIAFVSEVAIHLIARDLPTLSPLQEGLAEATLLSLLMLPALYIFLLVPNTRHAKQREALEQTLVENEQKLSSIFDTMSEGVALNEIVYDGNGEMIDCRILEVNRAFYATAGIAGQDVVGRLATDVYGMSVDDIRAFWHVHRHRTTVQQTELLSPRGGRWFHISTSPFTNNQFVTSFTDITERKQAEDTLRESEHLLRETQAIAGLGSYVLDIGTGTWTSSAILDEIFGIGADFPRSVEGWQSLVHPDWRERMSRHFLNEVLGQRRRFDMSYRIVRHRDGESRWVHGLGRLECDAAGRPLRMTGTITDITARKELEEQFFHAQRLESIGTLASGIAHDLNNVLAPIMMSVDLVLPMTTDERNRSLLEIAAASAKRGADIVAQVLSFSRGMAGRRVDVQIPHLVGEVEKVARETFPKNIVMRVEAGADVRMVMGDPTQLHQVLLNLCINARDAMPDGGQITVTARNVTLTADDAARQVDANAGPYVVIEVADTGTGIPAEILDRMFDPFFTTKDTSKGTGLGLSTARTIVKHHGGFLRVASQPGAGTSFQIYLPVLAPEPRVASRERAGVELRGHNEWILVVDDEEPVRKVTRHILENAGYRVLTASNGAEGVALYADRGSEIAAVIMDMMMPVMDGAAAAQSIVAINPAVRILAVSGVDTSHEALPEQGGAVAFLPKPYSADTLLRALRTLLTQPLPS